MSMTQTRRRFLTTLSLAGAAGALPPLRTRAAESPLENHHRPVGQDPGDLLCPAICLRRPTPGGGIYRYPLRRHQAVRLRAGSG